MPRPGPCVLIVPAVPSEPSPPPTLESGKANTWQDNKQLVVRDGVDRPSRFTHQGLRQNTQTTEGAKKAPVLRDYADRPSHFECLPTPLGSWGSLRLPYLTVPSPPPSPFARCLLECGGILKKPQCLLRGESVLEEFHCPIPHAVWQCMNGVQLPTAPIGNIPKEPQRPLPRLAWQCTRGSPLPTTSGNVAVY